MNKEVTILITEDDEGHATLIRKNLNRAGITNPILHFRDGDEVLDFLFRQGAPPHREPGVAYLLLLDIRMPRLDGMEVLRQLKTDPELCRLPVIMITTTDDPREVSRCRELGCNSHITKPVEIESFVMAMRQHGLGLTIIETTNGNGDGAQERAPLNREVY
jgi:CheY-like chemotaxis protein